MHGHLGKETTAVRSVQKEGRFPLANFAPGAVNGDAGGGSGLLRAVKYTVPQAARALGIGQTKMRFIVTHGGIPVVRIMGKTLVLEQDLEEYLRSGYGRVAPAKKLDGRIRPLPRRVLESGLLKKVS